MTTNKSTNEEYFDSLIRHQTYLLRYSSQVRDQIIGLLNATESDISRQIQEKLANTRGLSPRSLKKYKLLQAYIRKVRGGAWRDAEKIWYSEFADLVENEAKIASAALATVSPVVLDTVIPENRLLKALVKEHPFEGRVLSSWAKDIAATDIRRIEDQIKIGMVQGEDSKTIAKRVVGSANLKGTDGVTQITRANAQALTRTAVNSLSNAARQEFYIANNDLFEAEVFVATLDSRTTLVCAGNDGKQFKLGEGPVPPLHFNCRSLRVPVIDGKVLGDRPAKPTTEKQLLREFNAKNNLNAKSRDSLPRGTKGAFDEYKRKRIRELTGQVPAKTSYQEWLKKQSSSFQDDTLGKTKAKLFRQGGLTLDKFTDEKGTELTLSQLATKHKDAFTSAGLDPSDF